MKKDSLFSNLHHVSFVVRDADEAVAFFESLGVGPFIKAPYLDSDIKYRGKPADPWDIIEMMGKIGSLWLQIIQPIKGKSIWQEFLDAGGKGIHHLSFVVDDVDKVEAELSEKGFDIISSARIKVGGGDILVDVRKETGVFLEFLQLPPVDLLGK
jgi:methylmalonyl-CoA/ethylmalonyl-CoA epimerase